MLSRMAVPPSRPTDRLERAATWLSLACAAHCLLMPVAMTLMPLLGASLAPENPTLELVLNVIVVASALLGGWWGYRRHRDARVVLATVVGLAVYLVGHGLEGSTPGLALAVLGALVLASSSFLSARLQHAAEHPHHAH
ncbi:MAG: MerC domain-containing protein [Polyangiales bacterium]